MNSQQAAIRISMMNNQQQLNVQQQNQTAINQNQQSVTQPAISTGVSQPMSVAPTLSAVASSTSQAGQQPQQQIGSRERHTIWHGVLEWIEKAKNPTDQQKLTRHVPCSVSANSKDGEPEL